MPVPRALVLNMLFDGAAFAEALDSILLNATMTGNIEAQIRNEATVSDGKATYLLYNFLDKGTKPHWIGDADTLLANKSKGFGPVWGPVFHPGTRPYDISTRVGAYLDNWMKQFLEGGGAASLDLGGELQWREFRQLVLSGLSSAIDFAQSITPASWEAVRNSYRLYVNAPRSARAIDFRQTQV